MGKVGVISFPGSNGDRDAVHAFTVDIGVPAVLVDHRTVDLGGFDAIVLPGGFSYGDHLRCGAIAQFAPVVESVRAFADRGGPVLGICNGFQILTEAGLLPGALLRNQTLRFHCVWTGLRVEPNASAWMRDLQPGAVIQLPCAHGDGAYFADERTLDTLEQSQRVVFRYCDEHGQLTPEANHNGSARSIAGIVNSGGNVLGLMPHPERATSDLIGGADGARLLTTVLAMIGVPA